MTQTVALLHALAGYFLWVVVDTAMKFTSQEALSPPVIMASLGLGSAVCCVGVAWARKKPSLLRPQKAKPQALLGLYAIAINIANVLALKHLPLTVFYIAVFMCPLVIAVASAVLKHERLTATKVVCLAAGFFGVVCAINPGAETGIDAFGLAAAAASVVFFCISAITMQRLSKGADALTTQFYRALAVSGAGFLGALVYAPILPKFEPFAIMFVAGLINTFGMVFYIKGLQNTTSTNVAQLHYTQIISGALFGYVLFGEEPTWNLIAGSIVIIAAGLIVAKQARKNEAPLD